MKETQEEKQKIVIVPLSLFVETQQNKAVEAFKKLGVKSRDILLKSRTLNKIIQDFRSGNIRQKRFKQQIRALFPQVADLKDDPKFDAAWNAMCVVTGQTKKRVLELLDLKDKGTAVAVPATTNDIHVVHILNALEQLGLTAEQLNKFSEMLYLSYAERKTGHALLTSLYKELDNEIKEPLTKGQVSLFYTPPKPVSYPKNFVGRMLEKVDFLKIGRLASPISAFFHHQAERQVRVIRKFAKFSENSAVRLVRFSQKKTLEEALNTKARATRKTSPIVAHKMAPTQVIKKPTITKQPIVGADVVHLYPVTPPEARKKPKVN